MATTLEVRIHTLAQDIATQINTNKNLTGQELNQMSNKLTQLQSQINQFSQINDGGTSETDVLSASKVFSLIDQAKSAVKDEIIGGAGEAFDTLKELAAELTNSESGLGALLAKLKTKVSYSETQNLTSEQQSVARTNIAAASQGELSALAASIGNVGADFSATFFNALNGVAPVEVMAD